MARHQLTGGGGIAFQRSDVGDWVALLSKGFTQRHHQSTHFSFFRGPHPFFFPLPPFVWDSKTKIKRGWGYCVGDWVALLSKGFTQRHHQSTHFSFFRGPAAAAAAIASLPPSSHRCHRLTATLYGGKHQTTREGLWRSLRPRGKRFADQMMCNCVGLRDGLTREHRTRVNEQHTRSRPARSATPRP